MAALHEDTPRPQDDDRDDNENHCGAVETNAGVSDRADKIEGAGIEDEYEIAER